MDLNALLTRSIAIAAAAHEKQVDKAGKPYILHSIRVMMGVSTVEEKIVAVMHDILEDSDITIEELRQNRYPTNIIAALDCLTHRKAESYTNYINRIICNELASKIKLADLKDNMDLSRLTEITDKDLARAAKYHKARQRILASWGWK